MTTRRHLLLAVVAWLGQLATLLIPRSVASQEDMASHGLGYPIAFAVQNLSRLDPPSFPRRYAVLSPWEFPFEIDLARSVVAFGVILALLELGTWLLWRRRRTDAPGPTMAPRSP